MNAVSKAALGRALVDEIGFSRSYASEIVNGRKIPSMRKAIEIESKLGVPLKAWPEKTFLAAFWEQLRKAR